jgi:hypothetical protein
MPLQAGIDAYDLVKLCGEAFDKYFKDLSLDVNAFIEFKKTTIF